MDIKPIRTEQEYEAALVIVDDLFDAQPGTPEFDYLEILVILIETYEAEHFPVPFPDPIEAIQFHMDRLGLTRKDLEPMIGSRARVSEILNRKRTITLRMIRNLSAGLGISTDILTQSYPVEFDDDVESEQLSDAKSQIIHLYKRIYWSPASELENSHYLVFRNVQFDIRDNNLLLWEINALESTINISTQEVAFLNLMDKSADPKLASSLSERVIQ